MTVVLLGPLLRGEIRHHLKARPMLMAKRNPGGNSSPGLQWAVNAVKEVLLDY